MTKVISSTILILGVILSMGLAIRVLVTDRTNAMPLVVAADSPLATPTTIPTKPTMTPTTVAPTATPAIRIKAVAGGMAIPADPRAIAISPNAQAYTKAQLYRLIEVNWPKTPVRYDCQQALVGGSYLQGMYKTCHIVVGDPTQSIPVSYTVQIDGWRLIPKTE